MNPTSFHFGYRNGRHVTGWAATAVLLAAAAPLPASGQSPPSQFRSVTDARPRIADEHDRPYFRETQSHRGFEVRDEHFTVIATTSREDARFAAEHVGQAWRNASRLADRWTDVHRNPDFGLQLLQVVIDDEPLPDRDAPLVTVNVIGIQTQVQIRVGRGQPPLAEQAVRLREAAALAMFHAAGLDSAAPPWVFAGIAAFAGRQGLSEDERKAGESIRLPAEIGGQQWRYPRAAADSLAYPPLDLGEARQRVAFLLAGDDGEHAPAFFEQLQAASQAAHRDAAAGAGFRSFGGEPPKAVEPALFDRLVGQREKQFEAWKKNPLRGQPVLEIEASAAPDVAAAEREMALLLKLQRRFASGMAQTEGSARTKVVLFNREKGAVTLPAKQAASTVSFSALAARLADPRQSEWATLDVDGSLLLSSDRERLRELLDNAESRYRLELDGERIVLVRRLDAYRVVRGWLEENSEDKERPKARFEVVDLKTKPKVNRLQPVPPPLDGPNREARARSDIK